MTGWELLRAVAREDDRSDSEAAVEFLRRAGVRAVGSVELLMPLIEDGVAHERRNATREVERSALHSGSARRVIGDVIDSVNDRKRLLDASFALGDGRIVRWGEATIADHQARIELLARMRAGLTETMGQHEQAIALIESHGVTCLDEIEGDAA